MRSPLRKRIPRELGQDWKKYFALFAIMTIVIGFVAGMFVANDSMETAALQAYDKYNIEDGHFILKNEASDQLIDAFEKEDITVFNQFYKDVSEGENSVRIFITRDEVNKPCVMEGVLPTESNEIAIDRMHADNIKVSVGDEIEIAGKPMKVTGLVALPDYSTLFEDNSDVMFNALTFDIALVTDEGFKKIEGDTTYEYAFTYNNKPEDTDEAKKLSDDLIERLYILAATGGNEDNPDFENLNEVTDYVPEYANQAIHFAPDDMGSDKAMGEVLLIILIAVIAFIFAITESNTILNEASVIGTLRASGYTKGEMLRHYITVPIIVTLISALVGNVLGYTFFKEVVVMMYYNSYSLPTYETLWNMDAFVKTTVYPSVLVVLINIVVIRSKLSFSPLKFLRRDLTRSKRKKAIRLPKWTFLNRFRIRVLMQNANGYFTLALGIFFVMILLGFAVGLPSTLANYQEHAPEYIIADYQYILKNPKDSEGEYIETKESTAEKYSSRGLLTVDGVHVGEEVTAYGFLEDSDYFNLAGEAKRNEVWVSSAFAEKFSLKEGESLVLKEKYTKDEYDFVIKGIYQQEGIHAIFMPNDNFNDVFDYDEGHFSGFMSNNEIKDIDEDYIMTVVTVDDLLKLIRQLDHSLGGYMDYFAIGCLLLAILLIFLLTKLIIEKNAVSISMLKVLGYQSREINSIFIRLTSIMVVVFSLIGAWLCTFVLAQMWRMVMYDLSGWFEFYISPKDYIKMIMIVIVAYIIVMIFDMRRIKRIPMTEALKSVE